MTIGHKNRYEKLQDRDRETAKISLVCLTGEEILLIDQNRMIEQAKFTDSTLGKVLEKINKTN